MLKIKGVKNIKDSEMTKSGFEVLIMPTKKRKKDIKIIEAKE